MLPRRRTLLLAVTAASALCSACSKLGTSPSGGGGSNAVFIADPDSRFVGDLPAPLAVNGVTYVYVNTQSDGTQVQGSSDGVTFTQMPANYPAGVARSIVALPDQRYRMYYFATDTSTDMVSAVSSDGRTWTREAGLRFTRPNTGAVLKVHTLPAGGFRLYYPDGSNHNAATSSDGLTFTTEGPITLPLPDATSTWGSSSVIFANGQFQMVMPKFLQGTNPVLWHAVSIDAKTWTVDSHELAMNPGVSLTQPAWTVNSTTNRVYYRAQGSTGPGVIASGIVRF